MMVSILFITISTINSIILITITITIITTSISIAVGKKNILKTQAYKLAFWWLNICGTIYVQTKFTKEKNSS